MPKMTGDNEVRRKENAVKTIRKRIRGKKKEFLVAYEQLAWNISYACKSVGISRSTFYTWMKDEEFENEFIEIKEGLKDYAESKLVAQVKSGNMTAIIYYLKTQAKDRGYVEKSETDLNVRTIEVELTDD